jgi:hypothetical protein
MRAQYVEALGEGYIEEAETECVCG